MSLSIDSRKNGSSSTTEISCTFGMVPPAVRSNPPGGGPINALRTFAVTCASDCVRAMPLRVNLGVCFGTYPKAARRERPRPDAQLNFGISVRLYGMGLRCELDGRQSCELTKVRFAFT